MSTSTDLMRLSHAADIVEKITKERPHVATLHRWAQRGVAGVRLRTHYALGAKRTTEQWIREFFDAVDHAKSGRSSTASPVTASREARLRKVDADLAAELG